MKGVIVAAIAAFYYPYGGNAWYKVGRHNNSTDRRVILWDSIVK
jgi:hypothetical protein